MADWPNADDVVAWMKSQSIGTDGDDTDTLDISVAAATDQIRGRLDAELLPDDDACPDAVALAIMIRATALWMRRSSPTGIVATDPNGVYRVNRMDADVDQLIGPYILFPVA